MKHKLLGLAFGIAFGFWLGWVRFTDYDVIMGTLLLRDAYLWLIFSSAVATAAIGLRFLGPVGWAGTRPTRAHILGSALFGIGWAIAGACPGPAMAQLGRGQLAGLFTVAGIFIGVTLRGAKPIPTTGACAQ